MPENHHLIATEGGLPDLTRNTKTTVKVDNAIIRPTKSIELLGVSGVGDGAAPVSPKARGAGYNTRSGAYLGASPSTVPLQYSGQPR